MKILRIKHTDIINKGLALIILTTFLIAACTTASEIPANEIRSKKLNKVIMCPICPGESIDQATNSLSIQMRGIVREQIDDGWTDEQIKQFWIDRYGPSVILEPPREGFGLVAWLLPPLGIVVAALALYFTLRWMKRTPVIRSANTRRQVQLDERELSHYTERIEAMIDSDDSEPVQK